MLNRVDRIVMTATNAAAVAARWCELLDGEVLSQDALPVLAAERTTVALGDCLLEVLEPTGPGLARAHLDRGAGGPFAVGVSTSDPAALRAQLTERGVNGIELGEQLLLLPEALGVPGLTILVSPEAERRPVGLLKNLYEATHLTDDAPGAARAVAGLFGLDERVFVPIRSEQYGYDGTLTLFDDARLDRIETIHPFDPGKTMGRFFQRCGPCLYMCYGETDELPALRERLKTLAPQDWTGSDDNDDGLFVHPRALGGVMLGVSRTSHAWTWSGHPERRVPLPGE